MRERAQYNTSPANTGKLWSRVIIGAIVIIVIILIIKSIGSWGPSLDTAPVSLRLVDQLSSAQITEDNKHQNNVKTNTALSPKDLVEIRSGTGNIAFLSNQKNLLTLNTGTKLRYLGEQGTKSAFRLENKDCWIQSDTANTTFDLVGVSLSPASTTVMNVSKNELFTTITVFQWTATIDINGSLLDIVAGKQLNYSMLKSLTVDDLTSRINPINPDTLSSDWMKQNNASSFLTPSSTDSTTPSTTLQDTAGSFVLFDTPVDESTIESKVIDVSGRVLSPNVSRLIINGTPAVIDPVKQTFSLRSLPLTARENNIIYRTFSVSGGLLSKWFITVYTTANGLQSTVSGGSSSRAQVETYKPDPRFKIIAPSSDFYETREGKVKIEGKVDAGAANYITINDFKLGSFKPNGTAWYYFANEQFGNLQEGVNTYTIRYFDATDTEIYKNIFVIKKLPPFTSTGIKPVVSGEATN